MDFNKLRSSNSFMKFKRLLSVFIVLLALCYLQDLSIWLHHSPVFRRYPFAFPVFLFIILLVSIPFFIRWYKWLTSHSFVENRMEPVVLFALGGLCWLMVNWKMSNSTIDFHYRETYYIMSSTTVWQIVFLVFSIICVFYLVFPLIFKRNLNRDLSRIHFWGTYIGLNVLVGTWSTHNVLGGKRYYEYVGWNVNDQIQFLNKFNFGVLILVVIAQLLFLLNIIFSLLSQKKIVKNP